MTLTFEVEIMFDFVCWAFESRLSNACGIVTRVNFEFTVLTS